MHLWIAGSVEEVIRATGTGLVGAVVTNPTVIARWTAGGRSMESVLADAVRSVSVPVYVQLHGPDKHSFLRETESLKKLSTRIVPKLPATREGIEAVRELETAGIETLVTTVCSLPQAFAAAVAGASTICPYVARLNDVGDDAFRLIHTIREMYVRHDVTTKIMPASIRTTHDVEDVLRAGAHGVIIFYDLFETMFEHRVTRQSLEDFEKDWENINEKNE
jgi:transaldolase